VAVTPINVTQTVASAATRVQVTSDTDPKPSSIYFEALGTNGGYIYIGLSNVSSTVYIARLAAGVGFAISADGMGGAGRIGGVGLQLSDFWVDTSNSGDKVQVTYMYPMG
jgi:hypothetical protein